MTMATRSHITHFGLPGIDRIPFGMHGCHLYSTRDELHAHHLALQRSDAERCFETGLYDPRRSSRRRQS
jgi:hypothetical protein